MCTTYGEMREWRGEETTTDDVREIIRLFNQAADFPDLYSNVFSFPADNYIEREEERLCIKEQVAAEQAMGEDYEYPALKGGKTADESVLEC